MNNTSAYGGSNKYLAVAFCEGKSNSNGVKTKTRQYGYQQTAMGRFQGSGFFVHRGDLIQFVLPAGHLTDVGVHLDGDPHCTAGGLVLHF